MRISLVGKGMECAGGEASIGELAEHEELVEK